ncbi:MAG: enoyl-CoA hydratase/isomerase family protein [Curvibacter lanceolatus]|jgi:2-(1,2-epoxy-1,2-dihydrophenyl)acetyl-CoA isomerase|uniref:enoyl-CoA hydratase/isomerase family protein n=1 Tax=Curvibacter lanceolatus TaxID=86182 RepID=UPI0003698AC0|nr:enoyl-CoA hydratase-related protein [Curvibacter lanceolatus]MBV5291656.1 enoyl-CoA hydratase/isomerase family protein [Curvibacter lanceolatus]
MTASPKLLTHTEQGVLTLTLNRPGKLNAIDNELAEALLQALEAARDNTAVRAIRLRGEGRAFCAGRDVSAAPTEQDLVLVQSVSQALVGHPRPVLAEVHGWTVGAGFEWMLNADVVVAAEGTRFKLPEASLGVFVTGGLTATLPAMAGLARAKALTLLGDEFSAREARDWGLIWRVVPDAALQAHGLQTAQRLAALRPDVATQFKRVLNQIGLAGFDQAVAEENLAQRRLQAG